MKINKYTSKLHTITLFMFMLLSNYSLAASVTPHPSKVLLSQAFVIEIEYSDILCPFVEENANISSSLENGVFKVVIAHDPFPPCAPGVPMGFDNTLVVGPFTINSDEAAVNDIIGVSVVLDVAGEPTIENASALTIVAEAENNFKPISGIYWDKFRSGTGWSFEAQQDKVFTLVYAYDENGNSKWHAALGQLNNGVLTGTLNDFKDGSCLVCGNGFQFNSVGTDEFDYQVIFRRNGQNAFVTIGNQPQEALSLERFTFITQDSEPDLAGYSFVMPDLSGRWLFADLNDETDHFAVTFERVITQIPDFGQTLYQSSDSEYSISCFATSSIFIRNVQYLCQLTMPGSSGLKVLQEYTNENISHDRLNNDLIGVRLD
jgi:hypothetical protein